MARRPRIDLGGYIYHITARGNNGQDIFLDSRDYERYLANLRKTKEKYQYLLYAYVLMTNHLHLLLRPQLDGTVSKVMQTLNTAYTMYFNRKYERYGHLFQGRFKSFLVEEEPHLIELSRYIHLNPVRVGMVQKTEEYQYSSYISYLKEESDDLVDTTDILSRFGKRKEIQIKRYKVFVEEARQRKIYKPYEQLKDDRFLGSEEFRNKILMWQVNGGEEV
ncbi:MAG: transposase [Actinomycetota bacterium]|nr:transposase [Actinomycetota bacterium]MDI6821560.1 transposase [Actinomycetota bacterium]